MSSGGGRLTEGRGVYSWSGIVTPTTMFLCPVFCLFYYIETLVLKDIVVPSWQSNFDPGGGTGVATRDRRLDRDTGCNGCPDRDVHDRPA